MDTTEKEMYSDYPTSIIEDDVLEMLNDNDRSYSAFVLEHLSFRSQVLV
jgi:hypothetical protein